MPKLNYAVKSIQRLVEMYGGVLQMEQSDETFIVNILFTDWNLPESFD